MTLAGISVAIVDDEECVRVSLRRLAGALGLTATAYASGVAFLHALDASGARPDCLVLDAHMPQMTGLEVQQQLVSRGERFPTVIYTADDAPEVQARYMSAGAAEYLRKPVSAEEFLAAIERVVTASRRARELERIAV